MSQPTVVALRWDQRELDYFAGQLPKRFAYASTEALRSTALRLQQALFVDARNSLTIRKARFFFGSDKRIGGVAARITQFPSVRKGIAYAELTIGKSSEGSDKPAAVQRRLLYAGLEDGFERRPFTTGAKSVASPRTGGPARPTRESSIVREFTFASMRMQAFYKGKKIKRSTRHRKNAGVGLLGEYGVLAPPQESGGVQWKGRNRTFILFTKKHPLGEVLQRTGKGNTGLRLAWLFLRPYQVGKKLHVMDTVEKVTATYFREETQRQVQDAMQHDVKKALRGAL